MPTTSEPTAVKASAATKTGGEPSTSTNDKAKSAATGTESTGTEAAADEADTLESTMAFLNDHGQRFSDGATEEATEGAGETETEKSDRTEGADSTAAGEDETTTGSESETKEEGETSGGKPSEESEAEEKDDEKATTTDGRRDPRIRINPKRWEGREKDFAIVQLADRLDISLEEARERLYPAEKANAPDKAKAAGEGEGTDADEPTIESVTARLTAIDAEKAQAVTDWNLVLIETLNDEKIELRDKLSELKRSKAAREQEATQAFESAVADSYERLRPEFPDAFEEGSELESAVIAEIKRLQTSNPAIFIDEDWPEYVVPKVARKLGIAPVAVTKETPKKAPGKGEPAVAAVKSVPGKPKPTVGKPAVAAPTSGATSTAPARTAQPNAGNKPETLESVMNDLETMGERIVTRG